MTESKPTSLLYKIGLGVLALSLIVWAFLPVVPFLPISGAHKAVVGSIVFILAEVTFYAGLAMVGKDFFARIRARRAAKRK